MDATLTEWLRAEMDARGWTYSDLANALDVRPSTVSRLMSGSTTAPSLETMQSIAKTFTTPIGDVLAMADIEAPRPAADPPDSRRALRADPRLTPEDRKILVALYDRLSR